MKNIVIVILVFILVGCSSNNEQNPMSVVMGEPLTPYICNLNGSPIDTAYNGTEYLIKLFPITATDNPYINKVFYYLNEIIIEETSISPFTIKFTPNTLMGKYILRCAPIFIDNISWKTKDTTFVFGYKKFEPEPIHNDTSITSIAFRLSNSSNEYSHNAQNILLGNRLILQPIIKPETAKNKEVTITSSNEQVAQIFFANNEYNILANSVGFSNIIVTSKVGNFSANCELSVCDIDRYTSIELVAGTEGNSITGFNSYVCARFELNEITTMPLKINKIQIINDANDIVLTESDITFQFGQNNYRTSNIITSKGLQTYPAHD